MPKWIHERAKHLLARNPEMKKSTAFAVATQQSHALGKSPKGYGTPKGKRIAKAKYETPSDDVKKPNPGKLESPKLASSEPSPTLIEKDGGIGSFLGGFLPSAARAAPSATSGALKAQGVLSQMQKGRSFGGAAVDPFVKMRQQAQLGKLGSADALAGRLLPPE